MAHHSSFPFSARPGPLEQMNSALQRRAFGDPPAHLGATNQFPQGKLTPEDEGEIRVGITVHNGKVVIDFGKPTAWMGMDAEQARSIGELLIRRASEVDAHA
jgi:hypothetical protein